jgi:hypothetical protein
MVWMQVRGCSVPDWYEQFRQHLWSTCNTVACFLYMPAPKSCYGTLHVYACRVSICTMQPFMPGADVPCVHVASQMLL